MNSTIRLNNDPLLLIDYGHGGFVNGEYQTFGKQYHFTGKNQRKLSIYEGDINRKIALKLKELCLKNGVPFLDVLTGEIDTMHINPWDVPLKSRVRKANQVRRESYYLSIHSNAVASNQSGKGEPARGFSVFTSIGETESDKWASQQVHAYRRWFAGIYDGAIRSQAYQDGDPDYEANFYVLRKTKMPAILVENLFFDNYLDALALIEEGFQLQIAHSLLDGYLTHLKSKI